MMPPRMYQRGVTRPGLVGSGGACAFTLLEIIIAMALASTLVTLVSVAVLLAVSDEDELERLVLAYSPKFQAII